MSHFQILTDERGNHSAFFFASGEPVSPNELMYYISTEGVCITNGLPDVNTIAQFIKSISSQGGIRQWYRATKIAIWNEGNGNYLFEFSRDATGGGSSRSQIGLYTTAEIGAELILLFFANTKLFEKRVIELGNLITFHKSYIPYGMNAYQALNFKINNMPNKNTLSEETFWYL